MMPGWTALIPLKPPGLRKTRLQARLPVAARDALAEQLLAHAAATLASVPAISAIMLLAMEPLPGWPHGWIADCGRGLNAELAAAQSLLKGGNLLVIHPDLPLVRAADIAALLGAASPALAPDRHQAGTNALALPGFAEFRFGFGPGSFARHRAAAGPQTRVIDRPGLALDIDTPEDLDLALSQGFRAR